MDVLAFRLSVRVNAMKWLSPLLVAMLLAGCSQGLVIDSRYQAQGQSSRVQYVVLHYTSSDFPSSLKMLTEGEVSAHYLIDDQPDARIYRLVDESRRAWHAGDSSWDGRTWLNASTLGIELINPGYRVDAQGRRHWYPYPESQIDRLIELLLDIKKRHELPMDAFIGHSDIAPQRKVDPGPLSPWQRLAAAGLIRWPDAQQVAHVRQQFAGQLPDAAWFQQQLSQAGFRLLSTGQWDAETRNVLVAFQMKYRARLYDGQPDLETAALLKVLNQMAR